MLKHWIWLTQLQGVSNQTRLALLRHFGTPEDIYCADREEILLTEGITRQEADALEQRDLTAADTVLAECQRQNIGILTIADAAYPGRLKNIYDPPCLLYYRGQIPMIDDELAIAVVGTRDCTPYGVAATEKLSYGLAQGGAIIVTGLAKGIDAAAARGALRAGGKVIGVLGNGLDVYYPAESRYLYEDVAAAGVLISEYPPGTRPAGRNFPQRNRIISGLALATLVTEAPEKSGALLTAANALEQGRDVFAVPGPIDAPTSIGCNRLIREGAGLAAEAWDILQEYEARFPEKFCRQKAEQEPTVMGYKEVDRAEIKDVLPTLHLNRDDHGLTDDQMTLLRLLSQEDPALVDDLIEASGIPTRRVLSALTLLELENYVTQHSGKRYTRAVSLAE